MDLESLLRQCIAAKTGSKELVLNYGGDEGWSVGIGNTSSCVMLNESSPQFESSWCPDPKQAAAELLAKLQEVV